MFFNSAKLLVLFVWSFLLSLCLAQIPFDNTNRGGFIKSYGFPYEMYTVGTSDGYILPIDRIPYGKTSLPSVNKTRPVAFLMHGTWCDSSSWILKGPQKGLPFLLAERGYDVWMGNNRGTLAAKPYAKMSSTNSSYWDFTLHELALFDLPAMISYILLKTNQSDLTYIGHSQGATIFFILASENPSVYKNLVNTTVAIAPTVYISKTSSNVKFFANQAQSLRGVAKFLGIYEYFPYSPALQGLAYSFCSSGSLVISVCNSFVTGIWGPSYNSTFDFPLVASTFPSGGGIKLKWQLLQYMKTGKFAKFDYGERLNRKKYNSPTPTLYNLQNVQNNVIIVYGTKDSITTSPDVIKLVTAMPNATNLMQIAVTNYNHLDLLWGADVHVTYQNIINALSG